MKKVYFILFIITATFECIGQTSILFPEIYFGSDLLKVDKSQPWIGLFEDRGNQQHLQCIEVTFQEVQHPMIDEPGETKGIRVLSKPRNPKYIFSNPELFHSGKITTCEINRTTIFPEDTLVIQFLGNDYTLTASGNKKTLASGEIVIEDYVLFATSDKCSDQVMGEARFFDDNMFEILWTGDLNGDNQLDMIMNMSYKYSFQEIVLFLSTDETPELVFKEIGRSKKYFD